MILLKKHIVSDDFVQKIRLVDFAQQIFKDVIPSRNGIKKAIKKKQILVNGEYSILGQWVKIGDVIELFESEEQAPKAFEMELEIVYEDQDLAIINKPAGIEVSGNKFRTIQNALLYNIKKSTKPDALAWAKPVHRLDYATSGLLLIAKTQKARIVLGQAFENKTIQKRYQAIVMGTFLEEQGEINLLIDELPSETHYQVVKFVPSLKNEFLTLVNYFPLTGRTHQLRIHSAKLGMPILGDKIYGEEGHTLKGKGMFLCAVEVSFQHPVTQEDINIKIETPSKFEKILERENKMWQKAQQ